jgi:hypothetical protein
VNVLEMIAIGLTVAGIVPLAAMIVLIVALGDEEKRLARRQADRAALRGER